VFPDDVFPDDVFPDDVFPAGVVLLPPSEDLTLHAARKETMTTHEYLRIRANLCDSRLTEQPLTCSRSVVSVAEHLWGGSS
jgi:hypothetical protein